MPLSFESVSHGTIAFGFFNIETDMLLLEHYFFFAMDFCREISLLPERIAKGSASITWEIYDIPDFRSVGDLHGAITGTHLTGFIGEVYKLYPFPRQTERFKQNPEGYHTRHIIEKIIVRYGIKRAIPFGIDEEKKEVWIGEYVFTFAGFHALVQYVWGGGYPGWKDEERPEYVLNMKMAIENSNRALFKDVKLES